ncbi:hypothetical protein ACPA9J_09835 [Pseudomonas aeruginosa]
MTSSPPTSPAIRIISKVGPLANPADRDHCLQYMTAVPLDLRRPGGEHYEDAFHAAHPLIDRLREKWRSSRRRATAVNTWSGQALHRQRRGSVLRRRQQHRPGRPWSTRSAIAAGAPKASRCRRSSRPTCTRFPPALPEGSSTAMRPPGIAGSHAGGAASWTPLNAGAAWRALGSSRGPGGTWSRRLPSSGSRSPGRWR